MISITNKMSELCAKNVKKRALYRSADLITLEEYHDITHCACGAGLFKYHDSSKNIFVAKCINVKELYDQKQKLWTKNKKQPCDFICIFKAETPVFKKEIPIKKIKEIVVNPHKQLRYNLEVLFRYFYLDQSRKATLQEIDHLVKFHLWKKIKEKEETMENYYIRIFSEKIIDRNTKTIDLNNINTNSEYITIIDDMELEEPEEPEDDDSENDNESMIDEDAESMVDKEEEDDSENVETIDIPDYDDDEEPDYDYDD